MDRSRRRRTHLVLVATLICTWSCVSVIGAQDWAQDERSATENIDTVTIGGVALRVDPASGRLRTPAPEEVRQLRAAVRQMFASTKTADGVVTGPDGTKTLVLDEGYSVFFVAQLGGDGRLSTRCVTGASDAETIFDLTRSSGQGEEE